MIIYCWWVINRIQAASFPFCFLFNFLYPLRFLSFSFPLTSRGKSWRFCSEFQLECFLQFGIQLDHLSSKIVLLFCLWRDDRKQRSFSARLCIEENSGTLHSCLDGFYKFIQSFQKHHWFLSQYRIWRRWCQYNIGCLLRISHEINFGVDRRRH